MDRFLKRPSKDSVEEPSKKRKNSQKFRDEYRKLWPCLLPGKEGYAHCTVCKTEFSVAHGGRDDCRRHVACAKHVELERNQSRQQCVDSFFTRHDEEHDVIKSETFFVRFLVEHNIPLSVADHAAPLFSKMFPDSDIAKKFRCGHTKANAIAHSIADFSKEKIVDKLRCKHASVANIRSRHTASYESVKYFTKLFECCQDSDQLELEFARYQSDVFSSEILDSERVDTAWHKISQLKNSDGDLKYAILSKLMLSVLVVPHSNAPTERVFSMVRKNQTSMRSTMSIKTLESLLISKLNMNCCYSKEFSADELKKAKNACYKQLHKLN